jgi:uncharacterized membrane protein YhiD involved in acid resistance
MRGAPIPPRTVLGLGLLAVLAAACGSAALAAGVVPEEGAAAPGSVLMAEGVRYSLEDSLTLLARLSAAAVVGVLLALHPSRLRRAGKRPRRRRMAQAQIILTVAAALMIVVLNDSFERALGLVALGSFIRFRNVVGDPAETALIFLHVGLGMACGLGQYGIAVVGTLFVSVLLVPVLRYDARPKGSDGSDEESDAGPPARIEMKLRGEEVGAIAAGLRRLVESTPGVRLLALEESGTKSRVRAELLLPGELDPEDFVDALHAQVSTSIDETGWRRLDP